MPIPQLSKKIKSPQGWRGKKRKYYVSRDGHKSSWGNKNKFSKTKRPKLSSKIFSNLLKYSAVLFALFILFLFISVLWLSRSLPDPNKLINRQVAQSTKIYDRTGETILYEIHGAEKRTLVGLDEIPEYLKKATIAIEDKDFYIHGGFSVWAMFRTSITNILRGEKAGGSTLTQQLIKNAVLSSEKTYTRKIKELLLAYRVEKKFNKDEILQMYLNEIPYGSTSYGVEAASRRYFNKSAKDISLAEAAILAALPQAPSRYSPYGSNKDLLIDRQRYILNLMAKQGYITEEEAEEARKEEVEFKEQSDNITAPHFIMYIKELLSETYGEKMIEQEGLRIYTTIDLYKQKIAEEVITELAEKNEANFNASNAALISIDPKTGQILSMVGSRDYFNDDIDGQVNVVLQPRQPGSSFKPMVYAASFMQGYTPDTVLYDVVTNFSNNPDEPYEPHNYDDQEHGPVTIKKALAGSLNIPAVKTIYLAGTENVFDLADSMGYTTFSDRKRFGLSLVLGGGEVKLIEHTNAYGAFAREGESRPVSGILRVEDKDGKIIEEFKDKKTKVFDADIARMINGILSDNSARAYAFGEENWLTLGSRPVAAKTGTTNDYRDAWTIGYTPSIVTGVWVGNNDNSEMKRGAAGGSVAAPIWHNFMQRVLGDTPIEYFNKEEKKETGKPVLDGQTSGKIKIRIDRASGLLATEYTPESFIEEKTFKESHCILYYIDKDDPRGDPLKDPSKDPQFELWESRVLEWAEKQGIATSTPPAKYDNLHKLENRPNFTIEYPANNEIVMEPILSASIKASAPRGINRAEYYIGNNLLAVNYTYPFSLSANVNFLNNGFHKLLIKVCDNIDNCSENSLEFNLILDENQTTGDIGVSWKNLSNGLALNKIDFPFILEANVINPGQTAKVIFYLSPENEEVEKIIAIAQPIQSDIASAVWTTLPDSGAYRIYAEAHGWNGQLETSEELVININNEGD